MFIVAAYLVISNAAPLRLANLFLIYYFQVSNMYLEYASHEILYF